MLFSLSQYQNQISAKESRKFCKDNWINYEKYCYKLIGGPNIDRKYNDAQKECSNMQSRLFEPRHVSQQLLVNKMLQFIEKRTRQEVWIGDVNCKRS